MLKRLLLNNESKLFKRFDSGKALASIYDDNNPRETSKLTSIDIINHEKEKTYFKSYSETGFTLSNSFKIAGSCTALPKTILFWNVLRIEDVTEESLELVSVIEPKLDILIIGKGPRNAKPDYKMLLNLSKKLKINFEILPTVEALSTFNFLNYEDRNVAAFILPVRSFSFHEEDRAEILKLRRQRFDLLDDSISDHFVGVNEPLDKEFMFPKNPIYSGEPDRIGEAIKSIFDESNEQPKLKIGSDSEKKLIK